MCNLRLKPELKNFPLLLHHGGRIGSKPFLEYCPKTSQITFLEQFLKGNSTQDCEVLFTRIEKAAKFKL